MTDSFIRLPVDGLGKSTRTEEELVGTNTVHVQVVKVADASSPGIVFTLAKDSTLTDGSQKAEITNASIEQTTGAAHTDLSIAVAGKDDSGNVLPFPVTTDGVLVNLGANNDVTVTSGSVTANAGTNLNTSLLALESGGNLAAVATSLGVIDDWDESDRCKVNSIVGQAGIQGGAGAVTALTQRVVLATDQTAVPISQTAVVSSANSSITPLSGGVVFTGTAEIVNAYNLINVSVIASQLGTLSLQFSPDGTNWDSITTHSIPSGSAGARVFNLRPLAEYFRIVYTNGAAAQSYFRLETRYYPIGSTPSVPAESVLTANSQVLLTKGIGGGIVETTITTGSANGAYVTTRHDTNRCAVVSTGDSGSPAKIVTDGSFNTAFSYPVLFEVLPANLTKGVAYFLSNEVHAGNCAQQDNTDKITLAAAGTADITKKWDSSASSTNVFYVDISGWNSSDAFVTVNVYLYSPNAYHLGVPAYELVLSANIDERWVDGGLNAHVGKGEKYALFVPPLVALWNDGDARFGYVEVVEAGGTFAGFVQVCVGMKPFKNNLL